MGHLTIRHASARLLAVLTLVLAAACASSGTGDTHLPPATVGVHTVMGRAFFPGGVMLLLDAHLENGSAYGSMEYTEVQSRRDNTLRVFADVECLGLFRDNSEAVVAGPISRHFGGQVTEINPGDWWVVHVKEGKPEGDLISTTIARRARALTLCQNGPETAAHLRAVDGDLSIH
jgi:hypothetical protein